jgi:hypothetical protein
MIQNLNAIRDCGPRGLQVAKRRRDRPLGQIVARVIVKSDDKDTRVMAADGRNEVVQIRMVASEYGAALGDSPGQNSSIAGRPQTHVRRKQNVVPSSPHPCSQAATAHIFVNQYFHDRTGRSRPRARTSAASRSRSASISGRLFAT